jgi:hypothetical protein
MPFAGGSTGVPQAGVAPGGIQAFGGGKNSHMQNLDSPHSGLKSTITKGDPLSRMTNNYGKGHSLLGGTLGHSKNPNLQPVTERQQNPALHGIRGGLGQMRRIRGGLGPGKVGQPGASDQNYSMANPDME